MSEKKDLLDARLTRIAGTDIRSGRIFPKPKTSILMSWEWTIVPWYARLLGFLRLPYDLGKFIVTGKFTFIPWPWRW